MNLGNFDSGGYSLGYGYALMLSGVQGIFMDSIE